MPTDPDDKQGGAAGTAYDSAAQKWLRNKVAQDVEDVMERHSVGGVVLLASKEASAWRIILPSWVGLSRESPDAWRFRWKKEERVKADLTAHFVMALGDLTMHVAALFHDLSERLNAHVEIDHDPLPGLGKIKNPKKGDA